MTPEIPVTGVGNYVRGSDLLEYSVEVMETGAGTSGAQGTPRAGATSSGAGTGSSATQSSTPAAGNTASAGGAGAATQPSGSGGAANQAGTEVGTVNDVILPVMGVSGASQQTAWLVISVDESFLGLGPNQLIPVPLRNARVDETRQVVILDVTSAMLEQAPSFTSSQWPDLNMAGWDTGFMSYWDNPNAGGAGSSGGATQTGTPAAGATSGAGGAGGTNGGAMQTGTPAAGSTVGAGTGSSGMQTGTPAVGNTASAGGAGSATQPSGTGGAAANTNYVRLTELMDFSVQSSAVDTGMGGGSTTGTPGAGATSSGAGSTMQTGTPAAGATSGAGGAGSATQSTGGEAGGVSSQGALLGTVEDVIIDLSGMSASAGNPGNAGGNSGGSSSQVGTPTVVSGAGSSGSSTQQPGTRAGGTSGAPGLNKNAAAVYLVVSADPSQGLESSANLVAIPWQHVQSVQPDRQVILVNVPSSQFQQAPGFGANNWPEMIGSGWDQSWSNYWKGNNTNP